jgi:hypothetical protein
MGPPASRVRTEDDRPQMLVVSAPEGNEECYIRQLQAITGEPDQ